MKPLDEFRNDICRTENQIQNILDAFVERNGDIASLNIDISKTYIAYETGYVSTLLKVKFDVTI